MIYCISYHVLCRVNYCICNSSICPRPVLYKVLNNTMYTEYIRYRVKYKTCNNSTCRRLARVIPTPPQLSKITPTTCQIGTQNTSLPCRVLKSLLDVFVFKIIICLAQQTTKKFSFRDLSTMRVIFSIIENVVMKCDKICNASNIFRMRHNSRIFQDRIERNVIFSNFQQVIDLFSQKRVSFLRWVVS